MGKGLRGEVGETLILVSDRVARYPTATGHGSRLETRDKPMATVSMTKGAELAGVSKGTVSKALKSGRLSYAEKTDNGYLIDTSELFRVFPPKQPETVETARLDTPTGNRETLMETGGLLREVELLREQLRDRDGVVDDLRQRLDKSEDERREAQARVIGLLAGPGPTESKRGFFGRLFGRPDE